MRAVVRWSKVRPGADEGAVDKRSDGDLAVKKAKKAESCRKVHWPPERVSQEKDFETKGGTRAWWSRFLVRTMGVRAGQFDI